jgi:hypothetical protein
VKIKMFVQRSFLTHCAPTLGLQAMQSNGVLLFLTSILAIAKRSSVEIDISIIYLNNTLGFDEKKNQYFE